MSRHSTRLPAHQKVYRRLRERILFGELVPGAAVTIQGIAADLGAGLTPVREALRRLVAEGALHLQDNRRVIVPVLTEKDIKQLALLRLAIEPELARQAAAFADSEDCAELDRIDGALDTAIARGDIASYLTFNYRFHRALYAIAQAPILAATVDGLWLRFGPSMRVVCGQIGHGSLPDQHKALLTALETAQADAAAQAVRDDVKQGIAHLQAAVSQGKI